jgi:hypothetical protein
VPSSDHLYAVHVVDANCAYAVGQGGTIIKWDGNVWTEEVSGTTTALRGVWAASCDEVFAVGDHFPGDATRQGVLRRVGGLWQVLSVPGEIPDPPESNDHRTLFAISGSSASDVHIHGSNVYFNGRADANPLRWNGSALEEVTVHAFNGARVYDIWSVAADETYAAEFVVSNPSLIHRFDGAQWSQIHTGPSETLRGVWVDPAGDMFTAGAQCSVHRLTGSSTWETSADLFPCAATQNEMWGVFGVDKALAGDSPSVFAVGEAGTIYHYSEGWQALTSPVGNDLRDVHGADGLILAVGHEGTVMSFEPPTWRDARSFASTTIPVSFQVLSPTEMYGGGRWSFGGPSGNRSNEQAVRSWNDVSGDWEVLASSPSSTLGVYAAPTGEVFTGRRAGGPHPLAMYDTGTWTNVADLTERGHTLWGTAADNVYIAEQTAILAHWDGVTLVESTEVSQKIEAIWGPSEDEVWFVGTYSSTHRLCAPGGCGATGLSGFTGLWSDFSQSPPVGNHWWSVHGTSSNDVWIGGDSGQLRHYDGAGFTNFAVDCSSEVLHLVAFKNDDAYAACDSGELFRFDGLRWTRFKQQFPITQIVAMAGYAGELYVLGADGTVRRLWRARLP